MPVIAYIKGKKAVNVDVCNPCHVAFLTDCKLRDEGKKPEREMEWCEVCMKKLIKAGLPMRKPHGICAGCRNDAELVGEYPDYPQFKFCDKCCDPKTGALKWHMSFCTGCFSEKRVRPAYVLGDKVFELCKGCFNRYCPKNVQK